MATVKEAGDVLVKRIYTCMGCTWHRDVIVGPESGKSYTHQIYGPTTIRRAADLDIANHKCEAFRLRMAQIRFVWACAKAKGLM